MIVHTSWNRLAKTLTRDFTELLRYNDQIKVLWTHFLEEFKLDPKLDIG